MGALATSTQSLNLNDTAIDTAIVTCGDVCRFARVDSSFSVVLERLIIKEGAVAPSNDEETGRGATEESPEEEDPSSIDSSSSSSDEEEGGRCQWR